MAIPMITSTIFDKKISIVTAKFHFSTFAMATEADLPATEQGLNIFWAATTNRTSPESQYLFAALSKLMDCFATVSTLSGTLVINNIDIGDRSE